MLRSDGGDAFVEKVGQAGDNGIDRVLPQQAAKCDDVRGIQRTRTDARQAMGVADRSGALAVHVGEEDLVVTGFAQQATDEGPDLAGPQYKYSMHIFAF
jgi:hypothetical protein